MEEVNYDNYVSPTRLIQWLRCNALFKNSAILKLKGEATDTTGRDMGSTGHTILEAFYPEVDPEAAEKNALQHFSNIMSVNTNKYWDWARLDAEKKKEMEGILEIFVEDQTRIWNSLYEKAVAGDENAIIHFFPLAVEKEIVSDKYHVKCKIDRINRSKTLGDYKFTKAFPKHLLVDPKTLSSSDREKYDSDILQYEIQAIINAVCVFDEYGWMPTKMFYIFVRHLNHKKHGGILPIDITQERINRVFTLINQMVTSVNANYFPKTKDKTMCQMYKGCEYRTICDLDEIEIMTIL